MRSVPAEETRTYAGDGDRYKPISETSKAKEVERKAGLGRLLYSNLEYNKPMSAMPVDAAATMEGAW